MAKQKPRGPAWSTAPPPPRSAGLADGWYELRLVWRTQWRSLRGLIRASGDYWALAVIALLMGTPMLVGFWGLTMLGMRLVLEQTAPGPADAAAVTAGSAGFLAFGNLITIASAGTIMGHSTTIPLLFTLPLRRRAVLGGLVSQEYLFTGWSLFLATAPALGLLWARGSLWSGLVPTVLAVLAAGLCLTGVAVLLAVLVVRWLPAGRWQEWVLILAAAGGGGFMFLLQALVQRVAHSADPAAYLALLGRWVPGWSPPGWPGAVAALAAGGRAGAAWAVAAGGLAGALLFSWLLVNGLDRLYRDGLFGAGGEAGGAGGRGLPAAGRSLDPRPGWRRDPVWAMARREWRRITRSPRLLSQSLVVLLPMLATWVLNPVAEGPAAVRAALPFAVMLAACLVGLTMVGNEEQGWWLTRLSPMTDREIVRGKALAAFGLTAAIGGGLALLVAPLVGLRGLEFWLALLHTGLAAHVGTGLGLNGGCREPIFTPANKQQYAGMFAAFTASFGAMAWGGLTAGGYIAARWGLSHVWPAWVAELALTALLAAIQVPFGRWLLAQAARALPGARYDRTA